MYMLKQSAIHDQEIKILSDRPPATSKTFKTEGLRFERKDIWGVHL